ncbi:hypothetical protein CTAYLR_000647 [Chrysophaeum taylorii]|uniref:YHYH domain-containing protein n=1 Tax=Chrysophaeum taylorii TaxID=2483200 RepID=A0AAD7XJD2_9STRA|nr:hypothetical protein CTAYLR_000647 [Chrysophaeum taylorii]
MLFFAVVVWWAVAVWAQPRGGGGGSGCDDSLTADNACYAVNEERTYQIPVYPRYSSDVTVSLVEEGGVVGVLYDGAMLYSAYGGIKYDALDASYANDYENSAPYVEGGTFDMCGEHASSKEEPSWHAHVPPSCLLRQLGQTETEPSPQIGWALDGFPVYGPRGPNGTLVKSCAEPTASANFCADFCGGFYGDIGDGYEYRYYTMGYYNDDESCEMDLWASKSGSMCEYEWASTFYPFTPLCFHGCCPSEATCSDEDVPACGGADLPGTTEDLNATRVQSALPIYSAVESCDCGDYPSACAHFGSGEECSTDVDCLSGLECIAEICQDPAAPSPTMAPVKAYPTFSYLPSPTAEPALSPTTTTAAAPPSGRSSLSPSTFSPSVSYVAIGGSITLSGLWVENAKNSTVIVRRAIATSADVAIESVAVVFETRRRRLLQGGDVVVVVDYTITGSEAEVDAAEDKMTALTADEFDAALRAAAAASSVDFSGVTTLDLAAPSRLEEEEEEEPSSSSSSSSKKKKKKKKEDARSSVIIIISIAAVAAFVGLFCCVCYYCTWKKAHRDAYYKEGGDDELVRVSGPLPPRAGTPIARPVDHHQIELTEPPKAMVLH